MTSPAAAVDSVAARLVRRGFVHLRDIHESVAVGWRTAWAIFRAAAPHDAIGADMPPLEAVGEFSVPPPGAPVRDFQTLHIDFGLPVDPRRPVDVARFTALYIDCDRPPTSARTRVVPLSALLAQRPWVDRPALVDRLRRYGLLQAGDQGYVEGILGRLVEAADASFSLPSSQTPGFLCGLEFSSRRQERAHLAERGLDLDAVEAHVLLRPGELLLLDNLATAHGRLGVRAPLELHQLCVGYPQLETTRQPLLLDSILDAFPASRVAEADVGQQPVERLRQVPRPLAEQAQQHRNEHQPDERGVE
jgi:hypothetical protein